MGKLCLRGVTALLLVALLVAPARAVQVWGYREGLALASDGTHWGYAAPDGRIVIPLAFDSALQFSHGLGQVRQNGKLGILRPDGQFLLPPQYDSLTAVNAEVYIAQQGARWGLLSLLPFPDGAGGTTHDLYPPEYDAIERVQAGGIDVLRFTRGREQTMLPLFRISDLLLERQVPGARFPLGQGALPAYRDVSPRDWYALWVDLAYQLGLMEGIGSGRFAPLQHTTRAECIKLAACLDSRATGDDFHRQRQSGTPWYRPYVDYCSAAGSLREGMFTDFSRPATRAEVAQLLAATQLARSLPRYRAVTQGSIPDVRAGAAGADAVYDLYAKGILAGTDAAGSFRPHEEITRAEVAAMVCRMARPEQRV